MIKPIAIVICIVIIVLSFRELLKAIDEIFGNNDDDNEIDQDGIAFG